MNFDIDVPLFLAPVYGFRAAADARQVANFSGTMLFESGWEYGYWMSAIASYELSWNPRLDFESDESALADVFTSFLDSALGAGWGATMAKLGPLLRKPLIYGAGGDVNLLNGMAYLQGWVSGFLFFFVG